MYAILELMNNEQIPVTRKGWAQMLQKVKVQSIESTFGHVKTSVAFVHPNVLRVLLTGGIIRYMCQEYCENIFIYSSILFRYICLKFDFVLQFYLLLVCGTIVGCTSTICANH